MKVKNMSPRDRKVAATSYIGRQRHIQDVKREKHEHTFNIRKSKGRRFRHFCSECPAGFYFVEYNPSTIWGDRVAWDRYYANDRGPSETPRTAVLKVRPVPTHQNKCAARQAARQAALELGLKNKAKRQFIDNAVRGRAAWFSPHGISLTNTKFVKAWSEGKAVVRAQPGIMLQVTRQELDTDGIRVIAEAELVSYGPHANPLPELHGVEVVKASLPLGDHNPPSLAVGSGDILAKDVEKDAIRVGDADALGKKTVKELKDVADSIGVTYNTKTVKATLVEMILEKSAELRRR